jgi:hypothetical protein
MSRFFVSISLLAATFALMACGNGPVYTRNGIKLPGMIAGVLYLLEAYGDAKSTLCAPRLGSVAVEAASCYLCIDASERGFMFGDFSPRKLWIHTAKRQGEG